MSRENYDKALLEGRELTAEARTYRAVRFRDELLATVLKSIAARRSVLLVGPEGVGKTAIVHALAKQLVQSGRSKLFEFSSGQLLVGTLYLGEWQSKVAALIEAAVTAGALLYFTDVWTLPDIGRVNRSPANAWDMMRPRLLKGEMQIIGELTEERFLQQNAVPGFLAPFDIVAVPPLAPDQIESLLHGEAERLAMPMDAACCARLLDLCQQFLPASAGPGPPLALMAQVQHYRSEKQAIGEDEALTPAFIEKVFAVYAGLPRFVVSRREVRPVSEIRDWFRARIIGQRQAIDAVVEMITLFKAGLNDARRPVGSFLFVGPTGVGKTELARALAVYLFGSEQRLLRFDMSEFKDYHSFQILIGDPEKPDRPARLVDAVKAQPFQVVLFDELEKAHANVWDLLLQILDEGRLTPGQGPTVNFRNTIVIATSNVGARELERRTVGFTTPATDDADQRLQAELEVVFRPELLNRFQHLVRFLRLSIDEVREIARGELQRLLERGGIVGRRLSVDVGREVLDVVVARGYDDRYGARALKRELQRTVVMPIATLLMERHVEDDSILRLGVRHGEIVVQVADSEATRVRRREAAPQRVADGQKLTRESLGMLLDTAQQGIDSVIAGMGVATLRAEREQLELQRRNVDLWRDPRAAARLLDSCDRLDSVLERLERMGSRQQELRGQLAIAGRREEWVQLAEPVQQHARAVAQAERELLRIGAAGHHDALLEVRPIGHARAIRDLLYRTYAGWAEHRGYRLRLIREPMTDDEPAMIAVLGQYAFGYLRGERGLHRLRSERDSRAARVSVAPLGNQPAAVKMGLQRALKQTGQLGGKVRSRIEVAGTEFVVQNSGTLAENRELAGEFAPAWPGIDARVDTVVRRYDQEPFLLRDFLTATTNGRAEILRPEPFHELLCRRIDALAQGGKEPGDDTVSA